MEGLPADGITAATISAGLEGRENVGLSPVELLAACLLRQGAHAGMEPYVTGAGQVLTVHQESNGCSESCVVHNPSEHALRGAPTYWRADRQLMERTCAHGVGHPDPDDITFKRRMAARTAYHFFKLMPDAEAEQRASVYGNDRRKDGTITPGAPNWRRISARQAIRRARAESQHGCDGCCCSVAD